jgi:hypothetical protein
VPNAIAVPAGASFSAKFSDPPLVGNVALSGFTQGMRVEPVLSTIAYTIEEVEVAPAESVATAVRTCGPAGTLAHASE